MLVGCVLPWFAATGGDTGLTPITTNAFADKGIVVFICALAMLALVSLPYAAGDRPLGARSRPCPTGSSWPWPSAPSPGGRSSSS